VDPVVKITTPLFHLGNSNHSFVQGGPTIGHLNTIQPFKLNAFQQNVQRIHTTRNFYEFYAVVKLIFSVDKLNVIMDKVSFRRVLLTSFLQ